MIFFIFSFFLFLCALVESRQLFTLSALIVGSYFSFTYGYAYDWLNYYQSYQALGAGHDAFFHDPGFIFIMKLCLWLGVSFNFYSFLVNSVVYYLLYSACKVFKNPSFAFFAIFSFLGFFMFTEQIRQGLALAIVFWGFTRYYYSQRKKFLLTIFVAALFHLSALLSLFYFVILAKNNKEMILSFLLSSCLYLGFVFLLTHPDVLLVIEVLHSKFAAYGLLYTEVDNNIISFIVHSKMLFVYLVLMGYFFFLRLPGEQRFSTYSSLFLLSLTRTSSLLVRVGYYFFPVFIYSIDEFIHSMGRGLNTSLKKLFICTVVLVVSTIPIWTPMYYQGAKSHLLFWSDDNEINQEVMNKCKILHETSDINSDGCL